MSDALIFELDTAPFEEKLLEAESGLQQFREETQQNQFTSVPASGRTKEASFAGTASREKQEDRTEEQIELLLRELLSCAVKDSQCLEQIQMTLKQIADAQEQMLHQNDDEDDIVECVEYL